MMPTSFSQSRLKILLAAILLGFLGTAPAQDTFPDAAKHGSFLRVTEVEAKRLESRHDTPIP